MVKAEKEASVAASKATAAATKAGGYTPDEIRALADCEKCSWAARMPHCPVEWDDTKPAWWKEWRPRIEADGKSYQQELRTITGTRKGLMERMQAIYSDADPHQWIDTWQVRYPTSHRRSLL